MSAPSLSVFQQEQTNFICFSQEKGVTDLVFGCLPVHRTHVNRAEFLMI